VRRHRAYCSEVRLLLKDASDPSTNPPLSGFELHFYLNPQTTAMQGFFYNILSKMICNEDE
ncbi:MAG: hypothetical protein LUE86_01435, partial [Clostridiales bacterium]|nr:hypothetical protein [Clostridiales bacterium]